MQLKLKQLARAAITGTVLLTLYGCGGGGGGGAISNSSSDASAIPPVAGLTITGTAATGLAIASASINAKCQVGAGTATSSADGTFSLFVAGGALPCVLQITNPADGSKLHTVVTGNGDAATANITPLTEMLAARALGNTPAVFFAAFNAAIASSSITSSNVKTAQTDVGVVLNGTVDTTPLGDFIATKLAAATQGNPTGGDAQDKLLDALRTKIDGTQLPQVVQALANIPNTTDIKPVLANITNGKGISPYIGWNVSMTPAIYTYVMQLCYGSNQCKPVGGSVLMDVNPNDTITVSDTANGIPYGDVTRAQLQQIIDQGTVALNKIISNLWGGATTPSSAVIESVLNTALASATSPSDALARVTSGFVGRGFSAAAGDTATGTVTAGAVAGGYQCATTKTVNDPDWMQSHGSYWAAASAHDAYAACLKTGSEAACQNYRTVETQYCSYAKPACLAVATNASSCPG